jgi:hypothetical protein
MNKLKEFKGKIITVGRKGGPEYANDFIFPDGVRKEVGYVDENLHINYVCGMCADNSPCYIGGLLKDLERDIKKDYNIAYIREADERELERYIKDCEKFFNSVLKEKGRPPFARFPLPIIDKFYMDDFWKDALMREQNQ